VALPQAPGCAIPWGSKGAGAHLGLTGRRLRATSTRVVSVEMRLELVMVPVSDVDRAKAFYVQAGFQADHDHRVSDAVRFVQLTPPGSGCSIAIGTGLTDTPAGECPVALQLVVTDAEAARAELAGRGIDVSDVDEQPWGRFVYFADPDGNRWSVQQLPAG